MTHFYKRPRPQRGHLFVATPSPGDICPSGATYTEKNARNCTPRMTLTIRNIFWMILQIDMLPRWGKRSRGGADLLQTCRPSGQSRLGLLDATMLTFCTSKHESSLEDSPIGRRGPLEGFRNRRPFTIHVDDSRFTLRNLHLLNSP
jgi:hypothetical protein